MGIRASSSGIHLDENDAAIVKGMLKRGDRQHDVASWFGVNAGRIAEIAKEKRFSCVRAAHPRSLPPPGPYQSGKQTAVLLKAISEAHTALSKAEALVLKSHQ